MNWKQAPLVMFCLIQLSGCSSSDPDCGSESTKATVVKLAKDNVPNKLTTFIINNAILTMPEHAEPYPYPCEAIVSPTFDWWNASQNIKGTTQAAKERCKKYLDDKNKVLDASAYTLDVIRMTSQDAQTRKVACAASLSLSVPEWGSAKFDVTYQVEKTTDGQMYISTNDLK